MLKVYVTKKDLRQDDRLFKISSEHIGETYRNLRNRLAHKLQIPEISQIRLYDFRHYYASMLYHKTKDLLLVKSCLGHKDLRQTLRYTQLLGTSEDEEFTVRCAKSVKEASELIESGFEYVTEMDGIKLFRKRK